MPERRTVEVTFEIEAEDTSTLGFFVSRVPAMVRSLIDDTIGVERHGTGLSVSTSDIGSAVHHSFDLAPNSPAEGEGGQDGGKYGSHKTPGPAVGGSESRVAPGQPADGERSAPPTCSGYTARAWSPTSPEPGDARCVNCGEDHGSSRDHES